MGQVQERREREGERRGRRERREGRNRARKRMDWCLDIVNYNIHKINILNKLDIYNLRYIFYTYTKNQIFNTRGTY